MFSKGKQKGEETGDCHNQKGEGEHKTPKKAVSVLQPKLNPGCKKIFGEGAQKKKIKSTFSIIFIRKGNIELDKGISNIIFSRTESIVSCRGKAI